MTETPETSVSVPVVLHPCGMHTLSAQALAIQWGNTGHGLTLLDIMPAAQSLVPAPFTMALSAGASDTRFRGRARLVFTNLYIALAESELEAVGQVADTTVLLSPHPPGGFRFRAAHRLGDLLPICAELRGCEEFITGIRQSRTR